MREITKDEINLITNEYIDNMLKENVRIFLVEDSEETVEKKLGIFLQKIYGQRKIIFFAAGLDDSIEEIKSEFEDKYLFYSDNGNKIINPFAKIYIKISKESCIKKAIEFWTGSNPETRGFIITPNDNFTSISDIYKNIEVLILCIPSNMGYGYYLITKKI